MVEREHIESADWVFLIFLVVVLIVKLLPVLNTWLERLNIRLAKRQHERRKESLRAWVRERGVEPSDEASGCEGNDDDRDEMRRR